MIGEILGDRYELLEQIGEGGMAIVYKARDNKLNRFVAVKILKEEYSDNEEIVGKFKKEATAIAKLSDNNIVNVLDVGTQGDINYIVMELINGKTLKQVISEFGKIKYETALNIAIQVAKALDCAHKNNIIHRDIKPQNIMVTEDGVVKVTDFGIAKSTDSATLTNTSTILGSAHYFSPEQARGSFIDNRTDIYSLGIVMYEMVTGKVPFEADSPVTIALKHLQEKVVPPKNLNNKIPESLNEVILKCMEKDANSRYQDVKGLLSDLEKIKQNPNAIIDGVDNLNTDNDMTAQHTIIMDAIKAPIITNNGELKDDDLGNENLDDEDEDYYDEDYSEPEHEEENYIEPEDDEYDDYDEDYNESRFKKKKNNKGIIIGIAAVVIIALLGVGGYFAFGSGGSAKKVKVPNFVGMTFDEAKKQAESSGLKLVKIKEAKSDKKAGEVLETDPKAGEMVSKGSTINATVSGEEKIYMPNVVEDELNDAKTKLESLGVTNVEIKKDYSDSISEGKVISQDPSQNKEISKDTKVTLVVSLGKKYITIPELGGLSETTARNKLNNLGLSVNVKTGKTTDQSSDGKVIDSTPSSGEGVVEGSTVTLIIGSYEPESISVMDRISGMSYTEAVSELSKNNISASIADGYSENGSVISSYPSSVKPGGSVVLKTDTKKQEQVTPPDNNTDNNNNNSGDNNSNQNNNNQDNTNSDNNNSGNSNSNSGNSNSGNSNSSNSSQDNSGNNNGNNNSTSSNDSDNKNSDKQDNSNISQGGNNNSTADSNAQDKEQSKNDTSKSKSKSK